MVAVAQIKMVELLVLQQQLVVVERTLLAVLVLTQAAPVLAAPAAPITNHEVFEDVVIWILPAGRCPNLPADQTVIGFGDRLTTMDVTRFAETLERVCVETVESGQMTKDLALLISPDAPWPSGRAPGKKSRLLS